MDKIGVIIVDDHPLFREGVRNVINGEADLQVIGESITGEDALPMLKELRPDVALVDVNLPGINGIQVTRQV